MDRSLFLTTVGTNIARWQPFGSGNGIAKVDSIRNGGSQESELRVARRALEELLRAAEADTVNPQWAAAVVDDEH